MLAIVVGGVVLAWSPQAGTASDWRGAALVALACLCWAIDNNLTRQVAATDALFIAAFKGLVAGGVNTVLAMSLGATLPPWTTLLTITLVGLLGYGISLVLFVLALRGLGAARTGAYFSTAPFLGAALAVPILGESVSVLFGLAAGLMGLGVWLHVTEHHAHEHTHVDATTQKVLIHSHAHYPDVDHRHAHN
jgi:drug/metabolite transporter (DMT)-like permease